MKVPNIDNNARITVIRKPFFLKQITPVIIPANVTINKYMNILIISFAALSFVYMIIDRPILAANAIAPAITPKIFCFVLFLVK